MIGPDSRLLSAGNEVVMGKEKDKSNEAHPVETVLLKINSEPSTGLEHLDIVITEEGKKPSASEFLKPGEN